MLVSFLMYQYIFLSSSVPTILWIVVISCFICFFKNTKKMTVIIVYQMFCNALHIITISLQNKFFILLSCNIVVVSEIYAISRGSYMSTQHLILVSEEHSLRNIYENKCNIIHIYSGITSGRVLNRELLYTKILEVNSFAFAYRLFHENFSSIIGDFCITLLNAKVPDD